MHQRTDTQPQKLLDRDFFFFLAGVALFIDQFRVEKPLSDINTIFPTAYLFSNVL